MSLNNDDLANNSRSTLPLNKSTTLFSRQIGNNDNYYNHDYLKR